MLWRITWYDRDKLHNSLAPGGSGSYIKSAICELMLQIYAHKSINEVVVSCMAQITVDDWSTVQIIALNKKANSRFLVYIQTQSSALWTLASIFPGHWAFLAANKQLYEWYFLSVCLSVCLSVTPFWLCSHHRFIMKFSGLITTDQGNVHARGLGQRSKGKVTEVTT